MIRFLLTRILFFLFLFTSGNTFAQLSPYYIKNYTPKDYGGFNQMWQITQDKNGLMYFAGTSFVYVFDNTEFLPVLVKSGSANRQIMIDSASGIIYVGAVGEFGYIQRDSSNGKYEFHSMSGNLNGPQKEFSDIWKIFSLNGKVYFQSSERIFICEGKKVTGTIEAEHDKSFALMFKSGGRLFVRQRNVGLMEIVNDKIELCPGGERFATVRLLGIVPWKNGMNLVLSGDSGFYLMATGGQLGWLSNPRRTIFFKPFAEKPDTFLINHGPLGCKWVNDSTIGVFTRSGIGFFNRDLKLVNSLNKATGLGDESIAEIFVDRQKNIWLAHNNGISKVCYNSPALFFTDQAGYKGTVEWMQRYHGKLFVCSTEGLFCESTDADVVPSNIHFKRVEEIPHTEVWNLITLKDELFISSTMGIFYLHDEKIEQISNAYVNRICATSNPDEFIAIEKGGLSVYNFVDGHTPKMIKHFEMPGEDILRVGKIDHSAEGNYELWCSNRFKNIIHIGFTLLDTNLTTHYYDTINGIPEEQLYMAILHDTTYFFSSTTAYKYIPSLDKSANSKCFIRSPELFERLFSGNFEGMQLPFDFSLFLQKQHDPLTALYGIDVSNKFFRLKLPISSCFGGVEMQYAYAEANGIDWLTSGTTILRYDSKINSPSDLPFNAYISRVTIGKDSVIYWGSDNIDFTKGDAIPYQFNSMVFKFSSPYFEFDVDPDYYYKLDGFDTTWYSAKSNLEKSYMNLSEGTYTFKVKVVNLHGRISNEASYTFTILPPWYRSGWAYVSYFLIFIGIIFLTVRLSVRRLRKQKEKLEEIVRERTAEVVEQKNLVEEKHKEITDSINYAERIQKSFLASSDLLSKNLSDYFVFFRPRDVVSGDFYWAQILKNGNFLLVTADSTGHGVPGAIMSILNISCIERSVEEGFITPGELIDRTRYHIIDRLRKDGSENGGKDGMDCNFLSIDLKGGKIIYAAAHNPVWVVRKGELQEYAADKMPVGKHDLDNKPFSQHEITLEKGDVVYTFTDGFGDQFGGPKGKKFMSKRFQQLLTEIHLLPMTEQRTILEKKFLEWKGSLEQIDDVLVIGFRVN